MRLRCPSCGRELAEGKAYCENPACGAVPGRPAGNGTIKKELSFDLSLKLDFATLARAAALVLVLLALGYLYFFSGGPVRR